MDSTPKWHGSPEYRPPDSGARVADMPLQPTGHKASLRLARAWLAVSALSILLLSGCIFRSAEPLLFTSDRDGNRDVYTVDPDGGRLTRLTTDDANDYAPSWSPDRDRVLYLSQNGGGMSVMVMDADGSNQVKLAQHAVITSQSWSPDGEKVSYAVAAEDNKVELHVVDADGSNNRPVVFNRESSGSQPVPPYRSCGLCSHLVSQRERTGVSVT